MADSSSTIRKSSKQGAPGSRYGRWTLICVESEGERPALDRWLCLCDCGTRRAVTFREMARGNSKSCGCYRAEVTARRFSISRRGVIHAGLEYNSHNAMVNRCHNPSHKDYPYYGAIGRKVCDRWRFGDGAMSGFECFLEDMGRRPTRSHSIDRIDNEGDYSPGNCRWATKAQQSQNRSKF